MIDKKTDNIAAKSDFFIKKHGARGNNASLKVNKRTRRAPRTACIPARNYGFLISQIKESSRKMLKRFP